MLHITYLSSNPSNNKIFKIAWALELHQFWPRYIDLNKLIGGLVDHATHILSRPCSFRVLEKNISLFHFKVNLSSFGQNMEWRETI